MPAGEPYPWPAAPAYRYLDGAGPADFAWEWLRRDPAYRQLAHDTAPKAPDAFTTVALAAPECTARWGCLTRPDPLLTWRDAPILWRFGLDPSVLEVRALPLDGGDRPTFDLSRCGATALLVCGLDREHVLLRADTGTVRLDVLSGSLADGPVALVHDFTAAEAIELTLAALRRFLCLCRNGTLPPLPVPSVQRWQRQATALRVHDAQSEGASIRDIGLMLYGAERVRLEWSGEALKSQCRRLIDLAREMVSGGYRKLLLGP